MMINLLVTLISILLMAHSNIDTQTNEKEKIVKYETATLGGGCFWCTEAIYLNLKGVYKVLPGYSGGKVKNPSYAEVCNGNTGHAEVVQITFNPDEISFSEILEVFFTVHDPTTLNRQGNDIGTQYRSVIFYHDAIQKGIAERVVRKLNEDKVFKNPVVTEISPYTTFYVAEDYHLNYFNRNKNQPYCQFIIAPKIEKFHKVFKSKMK